MSKDLTEAQKAEYKQAFELFSKKKSTIDKEVLATVLRGLGKDSTKKELEEWTKKYADGDGKFDFQALCEIMAGTMKTNTTVDIQSAFDEFAKDGKISAPDLRRLIAKVGNKLPDKEVEDIIREADLDGDGNITYERFVMMMAGQ